MGVGIVLAVAKAGAVVGLVGRTEATLNDTAARIEAAGGTAMVLPCDITARDQVDQAVAALREKHGPV